ncbi:short-chain dehydrogenase, partial [Lipomyces tetrasporus]
TKVWHTDTYPSIRPSKPELSLAGKSVVITGGGLGIGRAIAQSFAKGHILQENSFKISSISNSVEVFLAPADISNKAEVEQAFAAIKDAFGPLEIMVNNAAYFAGASSILDEPIDKWLTSFEVNVKGTFLVAKAFLAISNPTPTVVNITSAIAHMPSSYFPGYSAYAASKMASTRFFDYLLSESPKLHVVSIHPGQVVTEMAEKVGMTTPIDLVELPTDFTVWAVSPEGKFLNGKLVWANWDVEELKARARQIERGGLLTIAIEGWPFQS